jgi:antagonist of KipI
MIRVLKSGLLTTVQDLGRLGFAHLGVSPSGAADRFSLRLANLLVGNPENTAALECTLLGPLLQFDERATVAITGSAISSGLPINQTLEVPAGQRLEIGSLLSGARAYIAIRGGIAVPEVMNSASTLLPATIGGLQGRALRAADVLQFGQCSTVPTRKLRNKSEFQKPTSGPLRVTETTQSDWFSAPTLLRFQSTVFKVSDHSNRSGIRLEGDAVQADRRSELITEGVSLGAIQVPADGQPIILFVDQQTTGGYPKIANVASADLSRVAQLRPHEEIKFQFVTFAEAVYLLRQQEQALREAFD